MTMIKLFTKVHIDGTINNPNDRDKGWSIEIAIPWKAFISNFRSNNPPKDGDQWKVNFSRVHWDTDIKDNKYKFEKGDIIMSKQAGLINYNLKKRYPFSFWFNLKTII